MPRVFDAIHMEKKSTVMAAGLVGSFIIALVLLSPAVLAYTVVTSCGTSSDGGSSGAVQIYYGPPYAE